MRQVFRDSNFPRFIRAVFARWFVRRDPESTSDKFVPRQPLLIRIGLVSILSRQRAFQAPSRKPANPNAFCSDHSSLIRTPLEGSPQSTFPSTNCLPPGTIGVPH
ncbi:hypothetical protein PGTUg99_009353 [Puccinia graminis f. sp. tritici]|uniref:Uncharacterized protein n=1 Tax=Puccinia graminis f. sp. tritici TaxID=56615 RepID=A0A5B0RYR4_PUCGR|nr:hypothetical protein PGTUg99_009353 [Puccinia graminis f. sp. tritici]